MQGLYTFGADGRVLQFQGLGQFAENIMGIKSNVCLPHARGNVQFFCAVCIALNPCVSGFAAGNRSHVKQSPDVAAY
jgi:hypothetical protein